MGPISESGFAPGWFQNGPIRPKGQPRDPDAAPLPWNTVSLVAMLTRRLELQFEHRKMYYKNGRVVEIASSLYGLRFH